MMTKREQQIFDDIISILKSNLSPQKIYLFGSRSKGNSTLQSDFDFAIQCDKIDSSIKNTIIKEIENISGLYKIDIVYLDEVEEEFKNIILKSGTVVYERRM